MAWPHVDFAPLEEYLSRTDTNHTQWAKRLKMERGSLLTLRRRGWLSEVLARRLANRLDVNVTTIWPELGAPAMTGDGSL